MNATHPLTPPRPQPPDHPHPSCVELGGKNPLVQIHDQGAGGNCNVVKEIIYPLGAEIDVRAVKVRGGGGRWVGWGVNRGVG
jgi:hypothetical protein